MWWKVTDLYFSIRFTCADIKIINALIRTFIYLAHDQLYSNDKKFLSEMIYTFQSFFGLFIVDGKFGGGYERLWYHSAKKAFISYLWHDVETKKKKKSLVSIFVCKKGKSNKGRKEENYFYINCNWNRDFYYTLVKSKGQIIFLFFITVFSIIFVDISLNIHIKTKYVFPIIKMEKYLSNTQ